MTFEIGKAVTEKPGARASTPSKYKVIFDAVAELKNGSMLPITFGDSKEVRAFVGASSGKIVISQRGNVVYCSKRND